MAIFQLDDVESICNEGRPLQSRDEAVAEWISAGDIENCDKKKIDNNRIEIIKKHILYLVWFKGEGNS